MDKNLGNAKAGEKIYKISLDASNIVEIGDGTITKALTIEKIEELGDYYSLLFTLSDGSHVRGHRNNHIMSVERVTDDKLAHPMAIFSDYYCQDKRRLLSEVDAKLKQDAERMTSLRSEAMKILNSCTVSRSIIEYVTKSMKDEDEITDEEFANMSL